LARSASSEVGPLTAFASVLLKIGELYSLNYWEIKISSLAS
jgi:hypothetical protein